MFWEPSIARFSTGQKNVMKSDYFKNFPPKESTNGLMDVMKFQIFYESLKDVKF
jgi:hypothetical protein